MTFLLSLVILVNPLLISHCSNHSRHQTQHSPERKPRRRLIDIFTRPSKRKESITAAAGTKATSKRGSRVLWYPQRQQRRRYKFNKSVQYHLGSRPPNDHNPKQKHNVMQFKQSCPVFHMHHVLLLVLMGSSARIQSTVEAHSFSEFVSTDNIDMRMRMVWILYGVTHRAVHSSHSPHLQDWAPARNDFEASEQAVFAFYQKLPSLGEVCVGRGGSFVLANRNFGLKEGCGFEPPVARMTSVGRRFRWGAVGQKAIWSPPAGAASHTNPPRSMEGARKRRRRVYEANIYHVG